MLDCTFIGSNVMAYFHDVSIQFAKKQFHFCEYSLSENVFENGMTGFNLSVKYILYPCHN